MNTMKYRISHDRGIALAITQPTGLVWLTPGLGPAAHGFDGTIRRWNISGYTQWQVAVSKDTDPVAGAERLTPENHVSERTYLELRTIEGTVLTEGEEDLTKPWIRAGWARLARTRLALTAAGWLRLDSLAGALANVRTQ